jgi:hypothetical protein
MNKQAQVFLLETTHHIEINAKAHKTIKYKKLMALSSGKGSYLMTLLRPEHMELNQQ